MIAKASKMKLFVRVYQKNKGPVTLSFDAINNFYTIHNIAGKEISTITVNVSGEEKPNYAIKAENFELQVYHKRKFKSFSENTWIDLSDEMSAFGLLIYGGSKYIVEIELGTEEECSRKLDVLEACEEYMESVLTLSITTRNEAKIFEDEFTKVKMVYSFVKNDADDMKDKVIK